MNHTLALKSDGTVVGWGGNSKGQINIPSGLNNVLDIQAGYEHSLALKNDGTVLGWGGNTYGEATVPLGITGVKSIAAGGNHSLVLFYSESVDPAQGFDDPDFLALNYPVDAAKDLLLIYNSNSSDSTTLKDYYLAHRPMAARANVLPIPCTTLSPVTYPFFAAGEAIADVDFQTQIQGGLATWLANNPTKRPQYIILLLDVPSRVYGTVGSVSYRLRQSVFGRKPLITHLNMGDFVACKAYIDKLESFGRTYSPGQLLIRPGVTCYGSSRYYFFDCAVGGQVPNDTQGLNAKLGVLENGVDSSLVTYRAPSEAHINTSSDVGGYFTKGVHGNWGANYAVDGSVTFSGRSAWYVIETQESFNGRRVDSGQGSFLEWFSSGAFGGLNYLNTPVGAVSHTEEPNSGINDTRKYFGLWASGRSFGASAWFSRKTTSFQAVGDPLVAIAPGTACQLSSPGGPLVIDSTSFLTDGSFQINFSGGPVGTVLNIQASANLSSWSTVGTKTITGSVVSYVDTTAPTQSARFYRIQNGAGTYRSANAVGFYRVTVPGKNASGSGGYAMIANQLYNFAGNNLNVILPNVPDDTILFKWNNSSHQYEDANTYLSGLGWYHDNYLNPGDAGFIQNGSTSSIQLVFSGEVPIGLLSLQIPNGSTTLSGILPQAASLVSGGFPAAVDDIIFRFNPTTQQFNDPSTYIQGAGWLPSIPTPAIGEAFVIQSGTSATRTWNRGYPLWP